MSRWDEEGKANAIPFLRHQYSCILQHLAAASGMPWQAKHPFGEGNMRQKCMEHSRVAHPFAPPSADAMAWDVSAKCQICCPNKPSCPGTPGPHPRHRSCMRCRSSEALTALVRREHFRIFVPLRENAGARLLCCTLSVINSDLERSKTMGCLLSAHTKSASNCSLSRWLAIWD